MSHIRAVLAILAGAALGVLVAELILGLGPRDSGICIAIIAACVIAWFGVRAVQRDQQRARDKARHPASQQYTLEEVFEMRDRLWGER